MRVPAVRLCGRIVLQGGVYNSQMGLMLEGYPLWAAVNIHIHIHIHH